MTLPITSLLCQIQFDRFPDMLADLESAILDAEDSAASALRRGLGDEAESHSRGVLVATQREVIRRRR